MGSIAILAALGLFALFASQSTPSTPQDDLKKLYAKDANAGNAVQALLVAQGNPAVIAQYAAQLAKDYPALSKALVDRFNQTVVKVTGKSGTVWNTWSGTPDANGVTNVDVLLDATPILSYSQTGADMTSRRFIGSAAGVDSATLARAKSDFMLPA